MREWKEEILVDNLESLIDYRGKTPKKSIEGILTLSAKSVKMGEIDYSQAYRISIETYKKFMTRGFPQKGDILMTTEAPLGCIAKLDRDNISVAQRLLTLRGKRNVLSNDYLMYYLMSRRGQHELLSRASGSTVQGIKRSEFERVKILLPAYNEQTQITKTLSVMDDKITLLRQQNATLEELAQLFFKRWFVEFEFPNKEGKPFKSNGGKMVESELGEIPEGWEVSSLGKNVETLGGGTPSTTEETYWTNGEIPWYSPTDLTAANSMFSDDSAKKITKLGLQKSSAKLFPPYSLLMSSRATVGLMTINTKEASTNQGFIITIPNDKFSIYFLYGWLKTKLKEIHTLASGSTFPEISKTDFRGLDLIVPTKDIKEGFDRLSKPIFKNIENNLKEIQTLTQLRDTLLPKLMSGEVRVKID